MNSSKPLIRLLVALSLSAAVAFSSGCVVVAAGAAGAGTVAYLRGELDATLAHGYDNVVRAADRAVKDLQFAKISERKDALAAQLVARTARDKKITIDVDKSAENLTRVRIRVGVFGDEALSHTLLDKIKANL